MAVIPDCWGSEPVRVNEDLWAAPPQVPLAEARSPPSGSAYACLVVAIAVFLHLLTFTAAQSHAFRTETSWKL